MGEPFYLSTLLIHRSNPHSLRSTSFSSLLLPYFNKKSNGFRTFSYAAPFLWNHLPITVRSAPTYMSFRKISKLIYLIKLFLLKQSSLKEIISSSDCALYSIAIFSGQVGFEPQFTGRS